MVSYDTTKIRKQSLVCDEKEALSLLKEANYGFLSMQDLEGGGYGIPMNYVFTGEAIYLHAALEGYKKDCLEKEQRVTFSVVGDIHTIPRKFTVNYTSVIVKGKVDIDLSYDEKLKALKLFVEKYSPEDKKVGHRFIEVRTERTWVFRLDISCISGKKKKLSD